MLFIAMFMLLSAGISYLSGMDSAFYPLLLSSLLTALLGAFPLIFVGKREQITNKEGFCIVVGAWLVACVVSLFPYLIWGGEFSLVNAWFESVSGLTTTGSTILNDVEALPRGLQFWRMSSTWIGGMGVVMFALVVLPSMGRSKMMLSNVGFRRWPRTTTATVRRSSCRSCWWSMWGLPCCRPCCSRWRA